MANLPTSPASAGVVISALGCCARPALERCWGACWPPQRRRRAAAAQEDSYEQILALRHQLQELQKKMSSEQENS